MVPLLLSLNRTHTRSRTDRSKYDGEGKAYTYMLAYFINFYFLREETTKNET